MTTSLKEKPVQHQVDCGTIYELLTERKRGRGRRERERERVGKRESILIGSIFINFTVKKVACI